MQKAIQNNEPPQNAVIGDGGAYLKNIIAMEEVLEGGAVVQMIIGIPTAGSSTPTVTIRRVEPSLLPVDSSLGAWNVHHSTECVSLNPKLADITRLWGYMSTSQVAIKAMRENIKQSLDSAGVVSLPPEAGLLR